MEFFSNWGATKVKPKQHKGATNHDLHHQSTNC